MNIRRCPRCGAYLLKEGDHYWCLACGEVDERTIPRPSDEELECHEAAEKSLLISASLRHYLAER